MRKMVFMALALGLAALPVLADNTVTHGSDLFQTAGDGSTYAQVSVPAGYFCTGSAAWSGTITLTGVPVVTSPANVLGNTDTVVERLADTTFDGSGNATVNAIVRVANFKATGPISVTGCTGSSLWDVRSSAAPTQSAFAMTLHRTSPTATGGTFDSDVTISPRLTFTQEGTGGLVHTLDQSTIHFTTSGASWTHQPGAGGLTYTTGSVQVDTDGDGVADTTVPPTSNFAAGWSTVAQSGCSTPPCGVGVPHSAITARHHINPPLPPCGTGLQAGLTVQRPQGTKSFTTQPVLQQHCYAVFTTDTTTIQP
jgi:hypothetical protein